MNYELQIYFRIFISIFSLLFSFYIIIRKRKNYIVYLFLALLFLSLTTGFASITDYIAFKYHKINYTLQIIFNILGSFTTAFYIQFMLSFPDYPLFYKRHKVILFTFNFTPVIYFLIISLTGNYYHESNIVNGIIVRSFIYPAYIFLAYNLIGTIFPIFILMGKLKFYSDIVIKKQISMILFGMFTGIFFIILSESLELLFGIKFILFELGTILSIVIIFISVIRYETFGIRTSIQYTILYSTLLLLIIVPLFIIQKMVLTNNENNQIWISIYGLLILTYSYIIYRFIYPILEIITFRQKYDFEELLVSLYNSKLNNIISTKELQNEVSRTILKSLNSKDCALLLEANNKVFSGKFINSDQYFLMNNSELEIINNYDILNYKIIKELGLNNKFGNKNIQLIYRLKNSDAIIGYLLLEGKDHINTLYF